MAKAENQSESQKTAEFMREVFKGKTIKTARRHKNHKSVTVVFTDGSKLIFDNDIFWNVNGDVVERREEPGNREGSLTATDPPAGLTFALAGPWWEGKVDWTRAHESAQQDEGPGRWWGHAYLHRKEGDQGNAAYWYGRAGKSVCREPFDAEWLVIRERMLE
jgi:hypothetical protein